MKRKIAVVTGATGGIGMEITRALLKEEFRVIMACRNREKAEQKRKELLRGSDLPEERIEVMHLDLFSLSGVAAFADRLLQREEKLDVLMNNAGTISTCYSQTQEGLEHTVGVNYVAPYLLTRKLLPLMAPGSRIVNMISCTYVIGKLTFPDFFTRGRRGMFRRLLVYSNTKLALLLFTLSLSDKLRERNVSVNAVDPGIVSTDMITMQKWFDPLADIFFRPLIRTPYQGAATAIDVLLNEQWKDTTGTLFVSDKPGKLSGNYLRHARIQELWEKTEEIVKEWL
ncbi:MAG: SDR family NAD(P)-dependent oxidoreductase [Bacteroides sp.]|nr:SDR family NAD(P)-dependent oxidoreductase [Bacteroides sp.]